MEAGPRVSAVSKTDIKINIGVSFSTTYICFEIPELEFEWIRIDQGRWGWTVGGLKGDWIHGGGLEGELRGGDCRL